MSHVAEMETDVNPKHVDDFIDSLKEHFGPENVEVNLNDPIELKRWNGMSMLQPYADYGVAPKCNIVVRRSSLEKKLGHSAATNDLGFRIADGKVEGFVDVSGYPKTASDQVSMDYAARVTAKVLKKKGYTLKKVVENGTVKLKASKFM